MIFPPVFNVFFSLVFVRLCTNLEPVSAMGTIVTATLPYAWPPRIFGEVGSDSGTVTPAL